MISESVKVPWSLRPEPIFSPLMGAFRTRRANKFQRSVGNRCHLVFWKRSYHDGPQAFLEDCFTGRTGVRNVAMDFGLRAGGIDWLITSGEFAGLTAMESGPHYAPFSSFYGDRIFSVDLSRVLCARRLFLALTAAVANPAVSHLGNRQILQVAFGLPSSQGVNCSSLMGRAILWQRDSLFAAALRKALRVRRHRGEITPADLARAASLAGLFHESTATHAPQRYIARSQGDLCS